MNYDLKGLPILNSVKRVSCKVNMLIHELCLTVVFSLWPKHKSKLLEMFPWQEKLKPCSVHLGCISRWLSSLMFTAKLTLPDLGNKVWIVFISTPATLQSCVKAEQHRASSGLSELRALFFISETFSRLVSVQLTGYTLPILSALVTSSLCFSCRVWDHNKMMKLITSINGSALFAEIVYMNEQQWLIHNWIFHSVLCKWARESACHQSTRDADRDMHPTNHPLL